MKSASDLVRSDVESILAGRTELLAALRGQHVFISGGTGFLGTWLLELMAELNRSHNFDLKATVFSRRARAFAARWPHLAQIRGVRFEEGDIRYISEVPRDVRFIIHAAALSDRRLLASQPAVVAETNGLGTLRLLQAANLLEDVQKFVLLSSGLVYGAQPWEMPGISETYAGPLRSAEVSSVYAESKRFAEVVAQCAISESKLPVVTLRPFAFVGPYQSLQLPWAVTDFIRDSLNGGPIRIMGDGSTVRSIMYGADFGFWVLAALARGRPREIYNVGSPEPIELGALARLITKHFSPQPEIRTRVGQSGHERNRLVPIVDKAVKDLGVSLTVPLDEAIQRTIAWNQSLRTS
jgi:nucleoside-diphosphate-sugar epimerase